jgi:hypothetical protein
LYKNHTITKQQYEQAGKARAKSGACFTTAKLPEISYCSKSKPQIKTDVAAANIKEPKPCLIQQIKSNIRSQLPLTGRYLN